MSHRTSADISVPWLRMVILAGNMTGVRDRVKLADMVTSMCDMRAAYYLDEGHSPDELDPHTGWPLASILDKKATP